MNNYKEMDMEITNELLAAYAERNVSEHERNAVRQYLTDNPDELETMIMMMDKDFELEVDDEDDVGDRVQLNIKDSFFDICYSAAAFAPRVIPMNNTIKDPPKIGKSIFNKRLDDLLDDIIG